MDANELFTICQELAEEEPSASSVRRMHELLVLCCSNGAREQGGTFGNLFSQIDWLCKHHGLSAADTIAIQTARRDSNQTTIEADDWRYDLRAVARFISAVFHADIPGTLLRLLPPINRQREGGLTIDWRYVRCIVQTFDDSLIHATTDDGEVTIDYAYNEQGRDFLYLRKILREGMQLNILDAHQEGNRLIPGLVVVEPDFLVDISSLASCFTSYGHHPLHYTLNRLKPSANTQAILLGNFAGDALDDLINDPESTVSHSLQRSYRKEAMRFCACDDFTKEKFETEAETQAANIREAVSELFSIYEREKALLEPSFVCERLGLQGRVDLMTADMQLLVEQKSGKNMKIEHHSHDPHGLQREDHYVQLLLYYGVLRYNFNKSDRQVDTRLLYSHYPAHQGLLTVNYYRTLFREAIRLRNQIVATEFLIARQGFGRILPLLCNDVVYKDVQRDGFFHQYVEPKLTMLNAQLSMLNTLEKTYFERMMTFVYREQLCQRLGVEEGHGGSTADLWQMPLNEKEETGNIYTGLIITSQQRSDEVGGYDLITLRLPTSQTSKNFRRGDMVYLYAYQSTPDVRQSILYKGILQEIGTDQLVVALNDGQQNPDVFAPDEQQQWAIEHGGSDNTASAGIRSLYQLMTADAYRRALLLGQRTPQADTSLTLTKSYHPAYNDIVLRVKQARDYFLLVGPPGTGKTSMALRFMVDEALASNPSAQLLLMAYTNRAVDEICEMLCTAGHPFLRIANAASCEPRFRQYLLEEMMKPTDTLDDIEAYVRQTRIVVGTTSMLQARPFIFQLKHFSLALIDEASQILEPGLVGLLASDAIDRFVLIGDHKQLPAVVQQSEEQAAVSEQCLRDICLTDCRQSLFERLLRWEQHEQRTQFVGTLKKQGRMHPDIALFPNDHFYRQEQLDIVPCPHQEEASLHYDAPSQDAIDDLLKQHRMLFLSVQKTEKTTSDQTNPDEARMVADLVRRIHRFYGERFDATKTLGIIVPYRNQITMIRQEIAHLGIEGLTDITIDTVERYQGSQRDVIIYSFTISRLYQLDFLTQNTFEENGQTIDRKLNVALTRARRQMLMVGNPAILNHNRLFRQLVSTCHHE